MIAILHTVVSHYRSKFFEQLHRKVPFDVFTFIKREEKEKENFNISDFKVNEISSYSFSKFLWYSIFPLLNKKYKTIVLMWNFGHITTWVLLITKRLHGKKIILWGHGISISRYESEELKPNMIMKAMAYFADGLWVYMEKEQTQWKEIFPLKDVVALNNTLSDTEIIVELKTTILQKKILKSKYEIENDILFIFCARFNSKFRRIDLLLQAINTFDKDKFGFIIIGEGPQKPDFSCYNNVYEFGSVYERTIKDELFSIADIYFQPGWIGLSVVEAMAYGKPIVTFRRSNTTLQCVEYSYIVDGVNGIIVDSIIDMQLKLDSLSVHDLSILGGAGQELVRNKLTIENMVRNAYSIIR